LNNAIKFTQKGSIILSAAPAGDLVCTKISVQDSGIGMTTEDTKKLFSNYTHIEFSGRAEVNPTGVGLGLSIAYDLAKLLGPKGQKGIVVESVPGIGSNFSFLAENKDEQLNCGGAGGQEFVVKKASDKSQTAVPDELRCTQPRIFPKLHTSFSTNLIIGSSEKPQLVESAASSKCECPRVLVVDDNPFNTMAFEAVLGSLNIKCDTVFDGHTAIDKIIDRQRTFCGIHCRPYGVVFMDQEMPGLTGSETVQEIKRLQVQGLVPPMKIIGCTAHGSSEEVEKFMESGIEMCIHKPITSSELQRILKRE
jgi:CheY-like chemotaxis protein